MRFTSLFFIFQCLVALAFALPSIPESGLRVFTRDVGPWREYLVQRADANFPGAITLTFRLNADQGSIREASLALNTAGENHDGAHVYITHTNRYSGHEVWAVRGNEATFQRNHRASIIGQAEHGGNTYFLTSYKSGGHMTKRSVL